MENNKCPECGLKMKYNIQLEYDHSPYYCDCGYADQCSSGFNEGTCKRCTEYSHCIRWEKIKNNELNPQDPICKYCSKTPNEIEEYVSASKENDFDSPNDYVRCQEGTYDRKSNTFACTVCYVKNELI